VATNVYGELCMSQAALADARSGHPPAILVLVHGITYGTYYWDFPYQPETYSTVNQLVKHGYATLNLDRVGDGKSDHPLSPLVNAPAQAEVVHQLVQKLKAGQIGGMPFGHVGLVGHSYGTVINWIESAIYNDTDLDIGTGYSDRVNPVAAGAFIGLSTPALASPIQQNQPWAVDPGYLQPLDTARGLPQLYYQPGVDQGVVETDRRLANTVTVGEVATFVEREYDGTHKNIRIPTFSIQGEYDIMTCGNNAEECSTDATATDDPAAVETKSARYTQWQSTAMNSQSCFRGAVIPDAAHNVALHRDARQFQNQVAFFADQAMGVHGENVAQYRSVCATHGPDIFDNLPELSRLVPPFPIAPPPLSAIIDPILGLLNGK
jgi:pimeloyl-ACP methyl ester carboxylesterase